MAGFYVYGNCVLIAGLQCPGDWKVRITQTITACHNQTTNIIGDD